jgi:HPr kinase/phosphorylase
MPQVSVAQLYEAKRETLELSWAGKQRGADVVLDRTKINESSQGLVGHLNFLHPNWIQVLSEPEIEYFSSLDDAEQKRRLERLIEEGLTCMIITDGLPVPDSLIALADSNGFAVLASPKPSVGLMWHMRDYLMRALAESTTLHGVFLDVLGMGVLLCGDSGVGKSELALELISRGNGLVADDVVELYRIAPTTLEGRCPPLLKDFLEVRGLGMLNIRSIYGETVVRRKKNLKLIVELKKPVGGVVPGLERLPLNATTQEVLGVMIRKVLLPVAAGRNLAVLVEAAVRNYILQLRGMDSTQEFIRRHEQQLASEG